MHLFSDLECIARLRVRTGKHPQPQAFVVDFEVVGEVVNRCHRTGEETRSTVEQVLGRVVDAVPNEWLWVDDEPRLALRTENVPRMEIGRQQDIIG